MMIMKKISCVLLVLFIAVGMVGCGSKNEKEDSSLDNMGETQTPEDNREGVETLDKSNVTTLKNMAKTALRLVFAFIDPLPDLLAELVCFGCSFFRAVLTHIVFKYHFHQFLR